MKITTAKILSEYIDGQILTKDFEKWTLENNELEQELGEKTFNSLRKLNLAEYSSRLEIEKLVDDKINYALVHKASIIELIKRFENKDIGILSGMHKLYKWAELGYLFLAKIDLIGNFGQQGKSLVHLIDDTMSKETQWEKLTSIEPNFIKELLEIKNKLESELIILTGQKQKFDFIGNQYRYEE